MSCVHVHIVWQGTPFPVFTFCVVLCVCVCCACCVLRVCYDRLGSVAALLQAVCPPLLECPPEDLSAALEAAQEEVLAPFASSADRRTVYITYGAVASAAASGSSCPPLPRGVCPCSN